MEIERKWLVWPSQIPYRLEEYNKLEIEQFYISYHPTIRARRIDEGNQYILTVKTKLPEATDDGLVRNEYELPLLPDEYEDLRLAAKGRTIVKTRYVVPLGNGLNQEIDLFHGELEGLAFMEIEFPNLETARDYPSPEWTVQDVTNDYEYKNSSLSEKGMPAKLKDRKGDGYER